MYLLDSTHCIDILDEVPEVGQRLRDLGDASVATCAIVRGELVYMAMKSRDREENLRRVNALFADLDVHPVDDAVAEHYGRLKAALLEHFGPRDEAKRRKTKVESLGFKDNDLWIAASAKRHGLIVVSSDHAFRRMAEAGGPPVETWQPLDEGQTSLGEPSPATR